MALDLLFLGDRRTEHQELGGLDPASFDAWNLLAAGPACMGVAGGPRNLDRWIHKVDPAQGSIIYTIRVLESRIGASTSCILLGVDTGSTCQALQIV